MVFVHNYLHVEPFQVICTSREVACEECCFGEGIRKSISTSTSLWNVLWVVML